MNDFFIFSIDKSEDSLKVLNSNSKNNNLHLICADIDDLEAYSIERFDIIVSSYAIYYSKNLEKLLLQYKNLMKENGNILLFGYSKNSNLELIDIINEITNEKIPYYENFLSQSILSVIDRIYNIQSFRFENKVIFRDIVEFNQWFVSSEFYTKCDNTEVLSIITDIIINKGEFSLTKDTLGFVLQYEE